MTRRIAVITTSRAEFGSYQPLLARLDGDPGIDFALVVGGSHLRPEHGMTVDEIGEAGFRIAARVELLSDDDGPAAMAEAMARGTSGFAAAFADLAPDIAVILGDRYEMHAAAVAAQAFALPLAHIHGGEITEGAIDDSFRHSMTKLAHLHFVATEEFRNRVIRMGEAPERVILSGALALDKMATVAPMSDDALAERIDMGLEPAPLLVTYHPETRDPTPPAARAAALLEALEGSGLPMVITAPNADPGGADIRRLMEEFAAARDRARFIVSLGTEAYVAMMRRAAAMVGNSSSGIIEAASAGLPVVNVGDRQKGRPRAANVIDTGPDAEAIAAAIGRATSPDFRRSLVGLRNPYAADRPAAEIIHRTLAEVALDGTLLRKAFYDGPGGK